jgi:hypothetical protein
MKNRLLRSAALVVVASATACTYNSKQDLLVAGGCDSSNTTYSNFVGTWLSNRGCVSCHGVGGTPPLLNDYAAVKAVATMPNFMGSIKRLPAYSPMPKGAPMSDSCDIKKLDAWIAAGMPQ